MCVCVCISKIKQNKRIDAYVGPSSQYIGSGVYNTLVVKQSLSFCHQYVVCAYTLLLLLWWAYNSQKSTSRLCAMCAGIPQMESWTTFNGKKATTGRRKTFSRMVCPASWSLCCWSLSGVITVLSPFYYGSMMLCWDQLGTDWVSIGYASLGTDFFQQLASVVIRTVDHPLGSPSLCFSSPVAQHVD